VSTISLNICYTHNVAWKYRLEYTPKNRLMCLTAFIRVYNILSRVIMNNSIFKLNSTLYFQGKFEMGKQLSELETVQLFKYSSFTRTL
jgi:hypothetical protein